MRVSKGVDIYNVALVGALVGMLSGSGWSVLSAYVTIVLGSAKLLPVVYPQHRKLIVTAIIGVHIMISTVVLMGTANA